MWVNDVTVLSQWQKKTENTSFCVNVASFLINHSVLLNLSGQKQQPITTDNRLTLDQ